MHPSTRHLILPGALLASGIGAAALALASGGAGAAALHTMSAKYDASDPALAAEVPFLAGNDRAMATMMSDMAIDPTGDVDKDFVDMMVPHHQGAIDMAKLVLQYGKSPVLKRLAQEIIVTQQQEIAAMRLAVGEPLPPSMPSPVAVTPATQ